MRRLNQICIATLDAAIDSELAPLQYTVLAHVCDAPGADQRSLAEKASVDRTSMTRMVDELEAMNLVERRLNGADRRAYALHPTRRGDQLRRRLQPKVRAAHQQQLLAVLSPEERTLFLDFLVRVIDSNREFLRPGAGRRKRGFKQRSPSKK